MRWGNPRELDQPTANSAFRRQIEIRKILLMVKWLKRDLATSLIFTALNEFLLFFIIVNGHG